MIGPSSSTGAKKTDQNVLIDLAEPLQISHSHTFIDFMNGIVNRPQLYHLGSGWSDEAAVGSTPRSGEFGINTGDSFNRLLYGRQELTGIGKERHSRELPDHFIVDCVPH